MKLTRIICFVLTTIAGLVFGVAVAAEPKLVTETFFLDGAEPGIKIHVRNKHVAIKKTFGSDRIVLFVHGATYPSETGFDIPLPGGSWLEYVAKRGFDAYFVDVRGYGRSTRPS
jgi:pimeloyl-ACP methyl ester carboxylesterase